MTKNIISIKKKINPILKRNDVKKAALFGSVARGEENKRSDVDILVEFKNDENKSLLDLVGLEFELEERLNRKVDVLTYDSIHPLLKEVILKDQKIIL
jgi:hypothetical protein